jgi:chain length determinant protein (polysaccharide antigen chain regulator)
MSEMRQQFDDEIDLFELFETVWNGKWTILLTSFFASLLSLGYIFFKPASFSVTSELNPASSSVFTRYAALNEVLKSNSFDYAIDKEKVFESFVSEFNDYEEVKMALKDNEYVLSTLAKTEPNEQKNILVSLAKEFKIQSPAKNQTNWTASFEWNDAEEGKKVLYSSINQTLDNVKSSVINDIDTLADALEIRNTLKAQQLDNDLRSLNEAITLEIEQRMLFLKEQASIARALDIKSNLLDASGLAKSQSSNVTLSEGNKVTLSVNSNDTSFYLRGYAAIEAELRMLELRTNEASLKFDNRYVSLMSDLALIKNDTSVQQLKVLKEVIENANAKEWVVFDPALADVKSNSKPALYLALAIVLGGMIGTVIVLIRSAIRKRKGEEVTA